MCDIGWPDFLALQDRRKHRRFGRLDRRRGVRVARTAMIGEFARVDYAPFDIKVTA